MDVKPTEKPLDPSGRNLSSVFAQEAPPLLLWRGFSLISRSASEGGSRGGAEGGAAFGVSQSDHPPPLAGGGFQLSLCLQEAAVFSAFILSS